jgi:hypothetical protein
MSRLAAPPRVARAALATLAGLAALAVVACSGPKRPPQADAAPAPATQAAASQPAPTTAREVTGTVEVRRAQGWVPLKAGEQLGKDDAIRTAPGSVATVAVGDDIEFQVQASSEVTLRDLTATASRVRLERGRVGASVTGKVVLRVESAHSTAVAEARRGKFAVYTDGKGLVAVAATAGEVRLSSSGGDALLAAGEQGRVVGDGAPTREPVPASVYLKVRWPEPAPGEKVLVVRGAAEVGAVVDVNGTPAPVGADGTFTASVPAGGARTKLHVTAVDLGGRSAHASATVGAVSRPPSVKVEKPEWK